MKEFMQEIKKFIAMRRQLADIKYITKQIKKLTKIIEKKIVQQDYVEFLYDEYEQRYGEDLRKLGKKYERL